MEPTATQSNVSYFKAGTKHDSLEQSVSRRRVAFFFLVPFLGALAACDIEVQALYCISCRCRHVARAPFFRLPHLTLLRFFLPSRAVLRHVSSQFFLYVYVSVSLPAQKWDQKRLHILLLVWAAYRQVRNSGPDSHAELPPELPNSDTKNNRTVLQNGEGTNINETNNQKRPTEKQRRGNQHMQGTDGRTDGRTEER